MHGYDLPGMQQPSLPQGPPPHQMTGPPMDGMMSQHHPDSTDSYVTYLESDDDDMQGSP